MSAATDQGQGSTRHLKVFGSPTLLAAGAPAPLGRRSRALLAYLELSAGRRGRRERLSGLFWPDRGEAQARASLRQCLTELRSVVGADMGADREWVWLETGALPSDHAALDAAIANGDARALRDALVAIGDEPLVDGLDLGQAFNEWVIVTRATTDRRIGEAVATLAARAVAARDCDGALALADAWLARDPLDERVTAAAISAERLRAAPAAAQRRARILAEALERDGLGAPGPVVAEALSGTIELAPEAAGLRATGPMPRGDQLRLPPKPSIAVLPFADLSIDAPSHAFADGIVEEISVALSRFSSLFVIAGQSSVTFRGANKSAQAIAAELGVRYLLEGSVRQAGGRIRIAVKLVDATCAEQIWADRFDGEFANIFDLQDQVAAQVASLIDSTITDAEMQRAATRRVPTPDAYELNLRANAALNSYSRQSIEEARALAEEAARLDPDYAWAVAIAGFCHAALYMNGWTDDPAASRARAESYIEQAMRVGADDLMALPVTAGAILNIDGDLRQARHLLERALELNAEKAFTLFWAGWLELLSDRVDLALAHFEKAMRLNPRSAYRPFQRMAIGNCLFLLDRFEEAAALQRDVMSTIPAYVAPRVVLAAALARLGRLDEARQALRWAQEHGAGQDLLVFRVASQRAKLREALALLDPPRRAPAEAKLAVGA